MTELLRKINHWWNGPTLSIYPTLKMTGKTGKQVWQTYRRQRKTYSQYGIKVNSPLPGEGIKDNKKLIGDRPGVTGDTIWAKDGKQIRKSAAFVFAKESMTSQGSIFELAKARGAMWKITVFINAKPGFISKKQSDFTCKNDCEAAKFLARHFLSRKQRVMWRLKFWPSAMIKSNIEKIEEFFK